MAALTYRPGPTEQPDPSRGGGYAAKRARADDRGLRLETAFILLAMIAAWVAGQCGSGHHGQRV
jgi:hypothetical protein